MHYVFKDYSIVVFVVTMLTFLYLITSCTSESSNYVPLDVEEIYVNTGGEVMVFNEDEVKGYYNIPSGNTIEIHLNDGRVIEAGTSNVVIVKKAE